MNPFEHLLILLSIIIGLSIADLLTSLHRLVRARARVRFHWLPLSWAAIVFLVLVQYWWVIFAYEDNALWTNFFGFLVLLLMPVTLYLASASVLPEVDRDDPIDLERHYFAHHRELFVLLAVYGLFAAVLSMLSGTGEVVFTTARALQLSIITLLLSLAVLRSSRYHSILTALVLVLLLTFVAAYTLRIA